MNPKDFTVNAAKKYLYEQYPSTINDETLTEADKIYNKKLAEAAKEKIKNPSSTSWNSMMGKQAEGAKGIGKSKTMMDMLDAMTPEARKEITSNPQAINKINKILSAQGSIKPSPIETPYGKSFPSYTPEGKVAGMAGKALRGLSKVAGPVGAALTAYDLGAALGEVQDLGAKKIAAEYEAEQAAKNEPKQNSMPQEITKSVPYSAEERMRLKELLKKFKGNPPLRE